MTKNLTAFLAQNAKKIDNVTFIASDRFVDPDTGEAMPWEICCITAAENAGLRKACMRTIPVPGRKGQFYAGLRRERLPREGSCPLHGVPESERRRAPAELRRYGRGAAYHHYADSCRVRGLLH